MVRNAWKCGLLAVVLLGMLAFPAFGGEDHATGTAAPEELCEGYGPQTPRDISNPEGSNSVVFSPAPPSTQLNLCNMHFHKQAEHKGPGFNLFAGEIDHGRFRCNDTKGLSKRELQPFDVNYCSNIAPGDTIEMHWVFTSCDVSPGKGLGSCLATDTTCLNPNLRVETQVFLLVNDRKALNFGDFVYGGNTVDGYHQPKALPSGTGDPVQFLGSTTGPSFSQATCSPLQVTWNVRPQCAKLDIASLSNWCAENVFKESKGHGVRQLVVAPELLSPIGESP